MSWRCERGYHAMRFVSMGNVRTVQIPGHSSHICRLTEKCKRCGYYRTIPSAPVPKRIKTYNWPTAEPPAPRKQPPARLPEGVPQPRYNAAGRRLPELRDERRSR